LTSDTYKLKLNDEVHLTHTIQ